MGLDKSIRRIGIVGAGAVGASWAAFYLARGFDVIATDPKPFADSKLRQAIDSAWPALQALGLSRRASPEHLSFAPDIASVAEEADFIQESGPQDWQRMIALVSEIDRHAPKGVVISSSSACVPVSTVQAACKHPERCVIGHAMNPPHLMPLVEVAPGERTSAETIKRVVSFYSAIGKKPIVIHKEFPGLVVTRLCAALHHEVDELRAEGILDSGDADTAISWGPGLLWILAGANTSSGGGTPDRFSNAERHELIALLRLRRKISSQSKA